MGTSWRTTFTDAIRTELEDIGGIGSVEREYNLDEVEYPSISVNIVGETPERELGISTGVITVDFEIVGRISVGEEGSEDLDNLVDDVIEKLEGITAYPIIIDSIEFNERSKGTRLTFELTGHAEVEKDFSSM